MWSLLYCCVILAIANPLWVQALPTTITSETIATNYTDSESPPTCPENEFYNPSAIACELTCARPLPQGECNQVQGPSCQCIEGFGRNETGKCVNINKCLDNIPFDIDSDALESTSYKTVIHEFIPNMNEGGPMDEPNNNFLPPYDFSGYRNFHDNHQLQAEIAMFLLQLNELKDIDIVMEYSEILAFLQAALQSKIRNLKLAQNGNYDGEYDAY